MSEPKQSFTEEIQKDRARLAELEAEGVEVTSHVWLKGKIEGMEKALSILSRGGEGREFWVDNSHAYSTKLISGNTYRAFSLESDLDAFILNTSDKIHVIEHSSLVAERARAEKAEDSLATQVSLYNELYDKYCREAPKLADENAALRAQLELCKEQRNKHISERGGFSWPAEIAVYDLELQKKGQGDESSR